MLPGGEFGLSGSGSLHRTSMSRHVHLAIVALSVYAHPSVGVRPPTGRCTGVARTGDDGCM